MLTTKIISLLLPYIWRPLLKLPYPLPPFSLVITILLSVSISLILFCLIHLLLFCFVLFYFSFSCTPKLFLLMTCKSIERTQVRQLCKNHHTGHSRGAGVLAPSDQLVCCEDWQPMSQEPLHPGHTGPAGPRLGQAKPMPFISTSARSFCHLLLQPNQYTPQLCIQ